MAEPMLRRWTMAEFLAWEERQPHRYELVNGQPTMMAGGSQAHALIATNIIAELRPRLRHGPCRPGGSDLRVPIPETGNVRYPDVTIDCGEYRPGSHDASEPVVVFEVVSPSTAWTDLHDKLRDYDRTRSITHYVIVWQDRPKVVVWTRGAGAHLVAGDDMTNPDDAIPLETVGVALRLADIYEGTGLIPA